MVTFTINIPQMLAYIPYMDPMGMCIYSEIFLVYDHNGQPRTDQKFTPGHRDFEMTWGLNMSIIVHYTDDYGYIPLQSH
jgi:hypothetical protein